MMIDYNVIDHWPEQTPDWIKSLVSSFDRRHSLSSVLPVTMVVHEITDWVNLASGVDAWKKRANRDSLSSDLEQATAGLGPSLKSCVAKQLQAFICAFNILTGSPRQTFEQSAGTRADAVWTDVLQAGNNLLEALTTDAAVSASWDDLVAAAQDRAQSGREYRQIAELLFEQVKLRGHHPDAVFQEIAATVAYGSGAHHFPANNELVSIADRLTSARQMLETPAPIESTVVWLGYKGRLHQELNSARLNIYDALWAVPNARPDGFDFPHKDELSELVEQGPIFRVSELADEESDVDTLVRVDLGVRTPAGSFEKAIAVVDVMFNISIHRAGGIRPQLAQYHALRSGQYAGGRHQAVWKEPGFPDDMYGAHLTSEAIQEHGPRIAEALSREELPQFLAAAVQVQTTADYPFSRDMAMRTPSEADLSSVIPLADRVVQHVAAHAKMDPNDLLVLLTAQWAHARWHSDLQRAAGVCLLGGGERSELLTELTREWFSKRPSQPFVLFLADRAQDFLSLCRVEHERAWIARMFRSISDYAVYSTLRKEYEHEGRVLDERRRRVRNALVHGNPASFSVVESVRDFANFLSGSALNSALESFIDGTDPASALAVRGSDYQAIQGGQDAASYWRGRVATDGWPFP